MTRSRNPTSGAGLTPAEGARPIAVIVSAADFPNGLSAPYRIRMLGRAFDSIGFQPLCVLQYAPGVAARGANRDVQGVYEGVPFVYPIGTIRPPTNGFRMLYYKTWGLLRTAAHIVGVGRRANLELVLSYGNSIIEDALYLLAARAVGARYVVEICDAPDVTLNPGARGVRWLRDRLKHAMVRVRDRFILPRSDFLFVISRNLRDMYASVFPPERTLLTPVIADADAYPPSVASAQGTGFRLLWIGNFRPFEGLDFLLEAMAVLAKRRDDFRCDVFGATPKHSHFVSHLSQRIHRLGLDGIVSLHDAVPHAEIPALVGSADVLLIPREDSPLNRSNLPTKLVDYLMSGRPVVSSAVGEILHYSHDGVDIAFPVDSSVEAYADAVEALLEDGERRESIGRAGRRLAEEFFDYRRVGSRIKEFLMRHGQARIGGSRGPMLPIPPGSPRRSR